MSEQWGPGEKAKTEKAFQRVMVGDAGVELVFGEHPHSRSDNNIYARATREDGTVEIEEFSGHRILWGIEIEEYNYLKQSGLSGDQIREGCLIKITLTTPEKGKEQVWEGFHRRWESALFEARKVILALEDCPFQIWNMDERSRLIGRKIWYRDQPGIVDMWIIEQGCIMIRPEGAQHFLAPAYRREDGESIEEEAVKVEITSDSIWWWRD